METVMMTLRDIPRDLRDRFKAACAYQGKSQQERFRELLEEEVKRFESGRKK